MSAIYGGNNHMGINNNIQISPNQNQFNFANPNRLIPSGG